MAAELFKRGDSLLFKQFCEIADDNDDEFEEGVDIGGTGSERDDELAFPLAPPVIPLLSSPGPSIQANKRFFLSNLLSTLE